MLAKSYSFQAVTTFGSACNAVMVANGWGRHIEYLNDRQLSKGFEWVTFAELQSCEVYVLGGSWQVLNSSVPRYCCLSCEIISLSFHSTTPLWES